MKNDTLIPWLHTIFFAEIWFWFAVAYGALYRGGLTVMSLSEALAFSAGVALGCSFALSGLSYFLNIFDPFLKYRKTLGLTGYYLAFAYALTLLLRFPQQYLGNFPSGFLTTEALLGLCAMAILTMMAVISNNWAIRFFGGNTWRSLLRTGYIAYTLLVIRAYVLESESWNHWARTLDTVPPPRLMLSGFACAVILLRIFLELRLRTTQKPASAKPIPAPMAIIQSPGSTQPSATVPAAQQPAQLSSLHQSSPNSPLA